MPGHCNERRSESGESGEDLLGVLERHEADQQIGNGTPASWRQIWQSADEREHIVGNRRNGSQLSTRHDNDNEL